MKITICGSIAFFENMLAVKKQLEERGHEVNIPPAHIADESGMMIPVLEYYRLRKADHPADWIWERKREAMKNYFEKIVWAEAILVLNYEKKGVPGYVGANTLLEMGLAMYLDKPIYLLHPIPEMDSKEELLGMKPIILNGVISSLCV